MVDWFVVIISFILGWVARSFYPMVKKFIKFIEKEKEEVKE